VIGGGVGEWVFEHAIEHLLCGRHSNPMAPQSMVSW